METWVGIWSIFLILGLTISQGICEDEDMGPKRDEDGRIICGAYDPLCEKFKQMMENTRSEELQRKFFDEFAAARTGSQWCYNKSSRHRCEKSGKMCHKNGKCGDILPEEDTQLVFDD